MERRERFHNQETRKKQQTKRMSDRDRLLPNGAAAMAGKESQIVYALIARGTVVLTEYTHPSTLVIEMKYGALRDERIT